MKLLVNDRLCCVKKMFAAVDQSYARFKERLSNRSTVFEVNSVCMTNLGREELLKCSPQTVQDSLCELL